MSLSEAQLLADVRRRFFSPRQSPSPKAVGVELELIPLIEFTRKPALAAKTASVLSELARKQSWKEKRTSSDPPAWELTDGGRISFEPGGQLEVSSSPHPTATSLIANTRQLVITLRDAMQHAGIELVASGVDPYNDIGAVPLQLHRERYTGMTHYFDSIGPSGVRMMRQTAALQINVERGESPLDRWLLLNAISPVVTALFSNSTQYAGRKTNHASYRAHLWRTLDDSRTGIPYDEQDPAARYANFALDAYAMRSGNSRHPYSTFREWMQSGDIGM
ncbi:MAG TPA: glutamate-cysteine ligase family protein, partial [Gemmatimonadaceae bacterium]|nr:glutamate-cysteine ligase family protein [Gemmatimonadaceae bacterium]